MKTSLMMAILFAPLVVFFLYAWYDHTARVQNWVRESVVDYQAEQIDWEALIAEEKEVILEEATQELLDLNRVPRLEFQREARYDYKESIYNLMDAVRTDGDRIEAVRELVVQRNEWLSVFDKFFENKLFAMFHTI